MLFLSGAAVGLGCVIFRLISTQHATSTPRCYRWLGLEGLGAGATGTAAYGGAVALGADPSLVATAATAALGTGAAGAYMRSSLSDHIGKRVKNDIDSRLAGQREHLAAELVERGMRQEFVIRYQTQRAAESHPSGVPGFRKSVGDLLRGQRWSEMQRTLAVLSYISGPREPNSLGELVGLDDWRIAKEIAQRLLEGNDQ